MVKEYVPVPYPRSPALATSTFVVYHDTSTPCPTIAAHSARIDFLSVSTASFGGNTTSSPSTTTL